jgi:hypothetical protein
MPMAVFMAGFTFVAFAYALAPETRLTEWAKDEAEERERRRAAGEEVEFGKNYFQERQRDEVMANFKRKA